MKRDAACKTVSGTWISVYDGITVTDAGKLDIGHVVPLARPPHVFARQSENRRFTLAPRARAL